MYSLKLDKILLDFYVCDTIGCMTDHRDEIDLAYFMFTEAMRDAATEFRFTGCKKYSRVPSWNEHCRLEVLSLNGFRQAS